MVKKNDVMIKKTVESLLSYRVTKLEKNVEKLKKERKTKKPVAKKPAAKKPAVKKPTVTKKNNNTNNNNTNNNNNNNIIAINEKKLIDENYDKINKKDVVEKDRTQQKNGLVIRRKALNTFSPAKGNNCNDLLIISPSETTSSCSNGDSMASPELSIYDLPSPSISHQQQEQPQSKLITVGRMSSQMPLENASVVSKGDETEKEHDKNVGVINANILQKQNINMKYNNANSKSNPTYSKLLTSMNAFASCD